MDGSGGDRKGHVGGCIRSEFVGSGINLVKKERFALYEPEALRGTVTVSF